MEIRDCQREDLPAMLEVINQSASWYTEILEPGTYPEPEMTQEELEREAERMRFFGAFIGGKLIGVVGLEYRMDAALIRHCYILPEHQRQGVGTVLLKHAEAQVEGVETIYIGTYKKNYKAIASLEKSGYIHAEDSPAILEKYFILPPGRGDHSLVMTKTVPK